MKPTKPPLQNLKMPLRDSLQMLTKKPGSFEPGFRFAVLNRWIVEGRVGVFKSG